MTRIKKDHTQEYKGRLLKSAHRIYVIKNNVNKNYKYQNTTLELIAGKGLNHNLFYFLLGHC